MTPEQKSIVDYAKSIAEFMPDEPFGKFMATLVEDGSWFDGMELIASNPDTDAWKRLHRPKKKECFYNAQSFVLDHCPKAKYFEGLCFIGVVPFDHAWVVLKGKVFDFTLEVVSRDIKKIKKVESFSPVYLGLPVPRKFLAKTVEETGISDSVAPFYYARKKRRSKKT